MSFPEITISVGQVIESTIIYGFVHTFWMCLKWGFRYLETDTGQIINSHVKNKHKARLVRCLEGNCTRLETAGDFPHQEESLPASQL